MNEMLSLLLRGMFSPQMTGTGRTRITRSVETLMAAPAKQLAMMFLQWPS